MQIHTAPTAEWQPLPCPRGATVLLLTCWGVCVKGIWYDQGQFIAWAPLPTIPQHIREKMR